MVRGQSSLIEVFQMLRLRYPVKSYVDNIGTGTSNDPSQKPPWPY